MNIFKLLILTILSSFTVHDLQAQDWTQKGQEIMGDKAYYRTGSSVSMPDPNTMAIASSTAATKNDTTTGLVRVYRWTDSVWLQKGLDFVGSGRRSTEGSGVSMPDSNTIAIGNTFAEGVGNYNQPSGQVKVHYWDGNKWIQKGQTIFGERGGSFIGDAITMPDPNTLAIGDARHYGREVGTTIGYVRIFKYSAGIWSLKGDSILGKTNSGSPNTAVKPDYMGTSLSMPDANTIAMAAFDSEVNGMHSGVVRVYNWVNMVWQQKGNDFVGESGDFLGSQVSMPNPNTVAFGAPGANNDSGYVKVYHWKNNQWEQRGQIIHGIGYHEQSGIAISMPDSNTIGIGAPFNAGGQVRIYNWKNNDWGQQGKSINRKENSERTGAALSMSNANTIVIGALLNNKNGNFAGAARVYTICSPAAATISPISCNSYTAPSGRYIWTTSGTYTDTISNANNCDSIITVHLTIDSLDISITNTAPTLTVNTANASYQWLDCDNSYAPLSKETLQSFTASINGNYAVEISKNGCIDTSDCIKISNATAISNNTFIKKMDLFPNPTDGKINVKLGDSYKNVTVIVTNLLGQTILDRNYQSVNRFDFNIEEKPGIYFVRVSAVGQTAVFKIVKTGR